MNLYVYLMGGLGNQLFQYAAGLSALKEYSHFTDLKLDTSFYRGQKRKIIVNGITGRGYDLDLFNIKYNVLEEAPEGSIMLQGWFQNIKDFENVIGEVKEQFTFKNTFSASIDKLAKKIKEEENSVCVHVRRADYINNLTAYNHHGVLSIEYYKNAKKIIENKHDKPIYYIFSDDIEWCKDNLHMDNETYFIGNEYCGDRDIGHLYLMQMCNNHIIANSTFSWWAAFLSNTNCVVAPKKWRQDGSGCDIILDDWIKI